MVDDSNSMAGEQESLKAAFPSLIRALTTGTRFDGDTKPFRSVDDLHVGVVSSDLGIPGVELPPSCHADGGDDGRLQHTPHGADCQAQYPRWLSFGSGPDATKDPAAFVDSFDCIASLGTGGCGFEEQLEAPFKALMPKTTRDETGTHPSPYRFLAIDESNSWGRGDLPAANGGNAGFLRDALDAKPSMVVVIVVTDEDDCSVKSTEHLKPNNQLPDSSPYRQQDINLRCYYNKQFLYDLDTRYFAGFRSLRPGFEDRVLFAAIAGVPTDLVSSDVLEKVDFQSNDSASRSAFFNNILADERMQELLDPTTMPGTGQGNTKPSCVRQVGTSSQPSTAFPPRRIVELARLFGKNGMVQSICQDDFSQPTRAIVDMIARRLEQPCPSQ